MASTPVVLIPAKYAEDAQTTQYTASNATVPIDKFTANNVSAGAETLAVNIVTSADTAGADNLVVTRQLGPGEVYTFPEVVGQILGNGDFISTLASAASAIVIRASGRTITT